jgi:hypothetical protein
MVSVNFLFFSLASETTWEMASLRTSVCNLLQQKAEGRCQKDYSVKDFVDVVLARQDHHTTEQKLPHLELHIVNRLFVRIQKL